MLHIYWNRPMPATRMAIIDHMAFSAKGLAERKLTFVNRIRYAASSEHF